MTSADYWHRCADKGTGKKQDIKITGASTLGSDEVDRMVKDAEKFADEVRIPSRLCVGVQLRDDTV